MVVSGHVFEQPSTAAGELEPGDGVPGGLDAWPPVIGEVPLRRQDDPERCAPPGHAGAVGMKFRT